MMLRFSNWLNLSPARIPPPTRSSRVSGLDLSFEFRRVIHRHLILSNEGGGEYVELMRESEQEDHVRKVCVSVATRNENRRSVFP